ncbi:MAG: ClbS/DfsB family four-helix bundle protein [Chloroflexi bacterium]|nr:ClbS/DfsB family four-helix bundle protein [Chloroflexota bacterium]
MDKRLVLNRLAGARAHLLVAVEGLSQIQMTALSISGFWTLREVLAHIGGWAAWDLRTIRAIQQGEHPDLSAIQEVDGFNARLVSERSQWSLEQILAEMAEAHAATQQLVDGLSDQELFGVGPFGGPYWDTLAEWLQIAWEHEEEHAVQIVTWRAHWGF